jgi:hypothetical protein
MERRLKAIRIDQPVEDAHWFVCSFGCVGVYLAGAKISDDNGRGVPALGAEAALTAVLEGGLSISGAAEIAAPFLPELTAPGRGVQAIVCYGSSLWSTVRRATSRPDFIVVVDDPRGWDRGLADRMWRQVLPPTVYCVRADGAPAKASVVTGRELVIETGFGAKDLHLAGRLSKRVALVWWRDPAARRRIVDAQRSALTLMARLALSRGAGDSVELDAFLRVLLALSYESEIRVVEPGKVEALFDAEREHYRTVGRALLATLGAAPIAGAADTFRLPPGAAARRSETRRRLHRSRRRSYLRWPKYLATFDGWLEYLVQKLARTGTVVSLSDRQRRHPFIFALPVLLRMIRTRRVA